MSDIQKITQADVKVRTNVQLDPDSEDLVSTVWVFWLINDGENNICRTKVIPQEGIVESLDSSIVDAAVEELTASLIAEYDIPQP